MENKAKEEKEKHQIRSFLCPLPLMSLSIKLPNPEALPVIGQVVISSEFQSDSN